MGPEALQRGPVRKQGSPGESEAGERCRGALKRGVHLTSMWKAPTIVSCVTWSWVCFHSNIRLARRTGLMGPKEEDQGAWAWPVWAVLAPWFLLGH